MSISVWVCLCINLESSGTLLANLEFNGPVCHVILSCVGKRVKIRKVRLSRLKPVPCLVGLFGTVTKLSRAAHLAPCDLSRVMPLLREAVTVVDDC